MENLKRADLFTGGGLIDLGRKSGCGGRQKAEECQT